MTNTYAGARHSRADAADMQTLHEIAVRQGAKCGEEDSSKMSGNHAGDDKSTHSHIDYSACFTFGDQYVAMKPGTPYLWMPFGVVKKGDSEHNFTPEMAKQLRLPHWKPAIKLGSHKDETPAGGHIIGFEIKSDGVWITPELTPNGEKAHSEGAYRYHSPEIIWPDGYLQTTTGEYVKGPFIMGDAWLHDPHLGESASLYNSNERKEDMTAENMTSVPTNLWEKFMAVIDKQLNPPAPTGDSPEVTKLKAEASEATRLKAELETLKASQTKATELAAMVVTLQNKDQYGALYADAKVAQTAAEHFTAMPKEAREWAQQQIRAMAAQLKDADTLKKFGKNTGQSTGATAADKFDAEIKRVSVDRKLSYPDAVQVVSKESPALYEEYIAERQAR